MGRATEQHEAQANRRRARARLAQGDERSCRLWPAGLYRPADFRDGQSAERRHIAGLLPYLALVVLGGGHHSLPCAGSNGAGSGWMMIRAADEAYAAAFRPRHCGGSVA